MDKIKKGWIIVMAALLFLTGVHADALEGPAKEPISFMTSKPNNGRLSFYFQNIEVRALLQLIAKNSGLNFVISDTVKGNVTLNLQNVTWQQALDVVLKSHGLASRRTGNIIYISTVEDITTNEAKRLQSEQAISNLEPLKSTIIHLKYASATDIANLLKSSQSNLLTSRGEVAVDSRTNSLVLRDTKTTLSDVVRQIQILDIPARQVLIEARIVNIDSTYEETLGVRFGVSNSRHLSGTFGAASAINNGTSPSALIDPTRRLNFNVPAHQLFDGTNPGSVAIALAHLGPVLLDLELSALEGENHAKIIARPRVITSNQKKAIIQTGQEIPYQEATSSGATSVTFKKAVLSLEITPQITPNNKIILVVKANEDTRGQSITTGASTTTGPVTIPEINTQSVESNILLNDQETIVLGGIYRQSRTNTVDRIPFLGTLPVVGYLFRSTGVRDEKHELLVFITPKIIRPLSDTPLAYKGE
jgi:type IV pilus assembly protein PilQ